MDGAVGFHSVWVLVTIVPTLTQIPTILDEKTSQGSNHTCKWKAITFLLKTKQTDVFFNEAYSIRIMFVSVKLVTISITC